VEERENEEKERKKVLKETHTNSEWQKGWGSQRIGDN